jgi:hypothetical protein
MNKAVLALCSGAMVLLAGVPAMAQQVVKIGLIMTYTGQFTDAAVQSGRWSCRQHRLVPARGSDPYDWAQIALHVTSRPRARG